MYGQLGLEEMLLSKYSLKTKYFSLLKTVEQSGSGTNQPPIP